MGENLQRYLLYCTGIYRNFTERIWRPWMKAPATSSALFFSLLLLLFVGTFLSRRLIDNTTLAGSHETPKKPHKKIEIPLNCTAINPNQTCPSNYPTTYEPEDLDHSSASQCPGYFRWIYEDLRPWYITKIKRDIVERAKSEATLKLVIVNGRAYVERYRGAYQTRDIFTLWGILQLLRRYPGKVPDLELMFSCNDQPVIKSSDYGGPNATAPPLLFVYSGNDATLDIVFPDWSFWGWPEINIKPWKPLLKDIKNGNKRTRWMKRKPYAYWKGNPGTSASRGDLLKCNVSEKQDWNARIYAQDWIRESQQGYKQSNLASQCNHRYKIYIEGHAWSVSLKYILACDSVTLMVNPYYYDFFSRSLEPMQHYWPIRVDDKCRSIKFAVDWGNSHKQKAQGIGKAASKIIEKDLKMDYVYDYMFHLLNEYAKLLEFKPTVPQNAIEICSETMACPVEGLKKKFMMESMEKGPSDTSPCTMPPPYDPPALHAFLRRKEDSIKQVEEWGKSYWGKQKKQP